MIRAALRDAYDRYPAYPMPSTVIAALADAGFEIISSSDLDDEIALAHQAGYDEGRESVGSAG